MLTYFPAPYPNEWWYSTLCRYHIRSGNSKHQATIKELFGGNPRAAMGTLFPNNTVHQVVSQLPAPWDCQSIIMNHTLFPYYVRMYKPEQKTKMLAALCGGESVTLTHIWKSTTKKTWRLRYCPICAQSDMQKYGETYWHREHQLPLSMSCCVHHCRLQSVGEPNPRLNEVFYPLTTEHITDAEEPVESWRETLSRVVSEYLTLPMEVGPTEGYSNLAQTLANNGYGVIKSSGITSLNAPRLYQDLISFYGASFIKEMLGTEISAFVLNRIISWNLSSPERYALLQTFAGLSTETMFSLAPVEDHLYQTLKRLSENGVLIIRWLNGK